MLSLQKILEIARPLLLAKPARQENNEGNRRNHMVYAEHEATYEQHDGPAERSEITRDLGRQAIAELGPDSLLWRWLGDNRMAFPGLSIGVLQLMHPAIGAGVDQHSTFFTDPWGRINRSMPYIYGAAYDKDARATAEKVRDIHRNVKGVDEKGRRYHAWNPDVWHWAHATFFHGTLQVADNYSHHQLTHDERNQLYDESRTWYDNWGISDAPVPETYDAFKDYWDDTVNNKLEVTPAAEQALEIALKGKVPRPSFVPEQVWPLFKLPMMPIGDHLGMLTIGELPERVRERFDIPFGRLNHVRLELFRTAVSQGWGLLPNALRYHPTAKAAFDRTNN